MDEITLPKNSLIYIILLSYNGETWLKNCIESLLISNYSNFRILMIDNASSDDSVALVKKCFPKVEILVNIENRGFAAGMNLGIKHALSSGADYVFLINQDTKVDVTCLRELVNVAYCDKRIGVLVPVQFKYGTTRLHAVFARWLKLNLGFDGDHLNGTDVKPFYEVKHASGAAMLVNLTAMKTVGLLDPIYFSYFEESDLCRRMRLHGFKIGLCPRAIFWHAEDESSQWKKLLLGRGHPIFWLKDPFKPLAVNITRATIVLMEDFLRNLLKLEVKYLWFLSKVCLELMLNFQKIRNRRLSEIKGYNGSWQIIDEYLKDTENYSCLSLINIVMSL